jgi:hypothetical protein
VNRVWRNYQLRLVEAEDDLRENFQTRRPTTRTALIRAHREFVAGKYDVKRLMRVDFELGDLPQRLSRLPPGNAADDRFYSALL